MRRSLEEPNSLRASTPIIQKVLSGASSPIDFANLSEIDTARAPPAIVKPNLCRGHSIARSLNCRGMPGCGTLSNFIRANGSLRPERPGLPTHRRGALPCQLAIPAHVIVKIAIISAIAKGERLRDCPASPPSAARPTVRGTCHDFAESPLLR